MTFYILTLLTKMWFYFPPILRQFVTDARQIVQTFEPWNVPFEFL